MRVVFQSLVNMWSTSEFLGVTEGIVLIFLLLLGMECFFLLCVVVTLGFIGEIFRCVVVGFVSIFSSIKCYFI